VGCEENQKEEYCQEMDEVMQGVQGNVDIVIGGDMNGHVGCNRIDYDRVHRGYGYGERNKAGERLLDFATANE
jgi:hypothetical protein